MERILALSEKTPHNKRFTELVQEIKQLVQKWMFNECWWLVCDVQCSSSTVSNVTSCKVGRWTSKNYQKWSFFGSETEDQLSRKWSMLGESRGTQVREVKRQNSRNSWKN